MLSCFPPKKIPPGSARTDALGQRWSAISRLPGGHKKSPGFPRVSGFTAASLVLWLCTVIGSAARSNPLNLIRLDLFFRPLSVCGFCRAHIGVPHTATAFLIPRVVRTSASLPHRVCKPPFVPRWRQAAKAPGTGHIAKKCAGVALPCSPAGLRHRCRTRASLPRLACGETLIRFCGSCATNSRRLLGGRKQEGETRRNFSESHYTYFSTQKVSWSILF